MDLIATFLSVLFVFACLFQFNDGFNDQNDEGDEWLVNIKNFCLKGGKNTVFFLFLTSYECQEKVIVTMLSK